MMKTFLRSLIVVALFALSQLAVANIQSGSPLRLELCDPALFEKVLTVDEKSEKKFDVFRFRMNTAISVIEFSSLDLQGSTMNRIAALVEKKGKARDSIVDEYELSADIQRQGEIAATYFMGHDYRMTDVARFFSLARQSGITLNSNEAALRDALLGLGLLRDNVLRRNFEGKENAAIVSVAAADILPGQQGTQVVYDLHATLRHELSHGEFFSNVAYHDYVLEKWRSIPESFRQIFVKDFDRMGYDVENEELMANEFQAYLWDAGSSAFIDLYLIKAGSSLGKMRMSFLAGLPEGDVSITRMFEIPAIRNVPSMIYREEVKEKISEPAL